MKFAADPGLMFQELPFMARFAAAKAAGFDGIALSAPYDQPAQEMRDQMVMNGLACAAMAGPPPNYTGGAPGHPATPGAEDRFARDFRRMLRYAEVLKPAVIVLEVGPGDPETLTRNLARACDAAPKWRLAIGPRAGWALTDYSAAEAVITAVAAPNLGLLFDTAEAQALTGDALGAWAQHGAGAALVQVAQSPGRDDPGAGAIDFPALFKAMAGYKGWVAAAYTPRLTTQAGLGWLPR